MKKLFPRSNRIFEINHTDSLLLLGSCFSDHLSLRFRNAGFNVQVNPMGTVFHPTPLARWIRESINEFSDERICHLRDVFLSWDASSEIYAFSSDDLTRKLQTVRHRFKERLSRTHTLFITLGSAHAYRYQDDFVVANCHKKNASEFVKEMSPLEDLLNEWRNTLPLLKTVTPSVQVVFTISPVRYSRDGWMENTRSKARLFELVGKLEKEFDIVYFPAYELVNDVLRDYRYFEKDGIHPNESAIDVVWELVCEWFMTPASRELTQQVQSLRQMENHRILFPGSEEAIRFRQLFEKKKKQLLSLNPSVNW